MIKNAVTLAAQADLVLLTVEMLRAPQTGADKRHRLWWEIPPPQLDALLTAALGRAADVADAETQRPSPRQALAAVVGCTADMVAADWCDEFCRLFDGAQACPLNQASYVRRDKGTILGDLSGFYRAFGFRPDEQTGERPDHLLCQLEFLAALLVMASRAPDEEASQIVQNALSNYARDHVHDWLSAVCWQMCEATRLEYFAAVAQWLLVLWQALTEFHHWPADPPPQNPLLPVIDPGDPYECGAPDLQQNDASPAVLR